MASYKNCQNLINNLSNLKMDTRDDTVGDTSTISPSNASPPDFDFNLPCRFFKSSFARSLSLNNATNSSSNNQCKSLDYDIRSNNNNNNNNSNNNKLSCLKRDMTAVSAVPPVPQRNISQAGSFCQQNEATACDSKLVFAAAAMVNDDFDADEVGEKPPALPARRPLSLHNLTLPQNLSVNECQMNAEQKLQQSMLTQLKQQTYKQAANNNSNNNSILPVIGNNNDNNNKNYNQTTGLQSSPQNQKPQPHNFTAASSNQHINCSNNNKNNLRRNTNNNNNHIVWPNQQKNVEQNCNICTYNQVNEENGDVDQLNSNYHDKTKLSTVTDYNNHFHNSHHMLHLIPSSNVHSNQLQHQQQEQLQQQHQMSSYEILNDNTTNVEAVILQNQVDTLQWQLKQVETSCDMYRAVMEEVARFLERYQSQKQQQKQQEQQQQQMATQKHNNNSSKHNNNKMEQIPRSKSLFQVYIAGGHEKSKNGNNVFDETATSLSSSTSTSYLRARSSTNLIDLKHQQQSNASCNSKSKDDHHFETGLTPSQSYSALKDLTWRRSPKKTDSRFNTAKDDVEEKLNQEAFRLLRTIHNLLNTSQHKPDLANNRHSLAPVSALQMGRLSKAISTTSVMTLPGPPMLNSTSLLAGASSAGSSTPDSSNASPTISTANNAASNNLAAPEMLFLRSANMRDSRLSLRSSTDSSVHSTSSAASSASSKVETDEEPSTPFHSPPNILTHKQHHHLAGSSTEDESGFSSISSFPDIGVPLSSTLLSSTSSSSSKSRIISKEPKSLKVNERDLQTSDSRNSTLKANVVGLPLNSSQDMSHRWDSPSKTYHNASNKFQRFSALTNEDSNTVLWV